MAKAKKHRKFYTKNLKDRLTMEQINTINRAIRIKKSALNLDKIIEKYRNMYYRCYSDNNHETHPYNESSTICDEWLDETDGLFNFSMWCIQNYYEIDGEEAVHLDKDILVKGNTVYSPDTCCFVPVKINTMFSGSTKKSDNDLPKGITYSERTGKYKPYVVGFDGKVVRNIGWYETPEEAWEVYALHRKAWIMVVADMYKEYIPTKLYEAMIKWELSIND